MNQVNLLISSLQTGISDIPVQQTKEVSSDLSFENLMSSAKGSEQTLKQSKDFGTDDNSQPSVKDSYESSYKKTDTVKVREDGSLEEDNPLKTDVLEAAEKISDVIEEELNVTEEEIAEVLDTLGLTYLDLLTTGGLSQVVTELSGAADVTELITSDAFKNILAAQSEVLSEMPGQLTDILQDFEAYMKGEELPESITNQIEVLIENVKTDISENGINLSAFAEEETIVTDAEDDIGAAAIPETDIITETIEDGKEIAETVDTYDVKKAQMPKLDTARDNITSEAGPIQEADDEEQINIIQTNTSSENTSEEGGQLLSGNDKPTNQETKEESELDRMQALFEEPKENTQVYTTQNVTTQDVTGGVMQTTTTTTSYIDPQTAQNIISQVTENVFLQVADESTTMELQLNPENLGKLFVSVTTKEGEVSAQLQTQNEAVKAALESQMNVLKETLAAQGIKVTEVEVTVASHEFEENLEKNQAGTFGEETGEENRGENQGTRRRNINLGELDSLSGLMSEEEELIARIMAENGNTMDLTA